MMAERDTTDRYLASYLSERVGNEFTGRINGIQRFGAFVKLDNTGGADGLIPVGSIGAEYFIYDRDEQTLTGGERSGLVLGIGQQVTIRLSEAIPVTGGLMLELLEVEGRTLPPRPGRGKSGRSTPPRKAQKARRKAAKVKKKVSRTRR